MNKKKLAVVGGIVGAIVVGVLGVKSLIKPVGIYVNADKVYQFSDVDVSSIMVEYSFLKDSESLVNVKSDYMLNSSSYLTDSIGVYLEDDYFETKVNNFIYYRNVDWSWDLSDDELLQMCTNGVDDLSKFVGTVYYADGSTNTIVADSINLKQVSKGANIYISYMGDNYVKTATFSDGFIPSIIEGIDSDYDPGESYLSVDDSDDGNQNLMRIQIPTGDPVSITETESGVVVVYLDQYGRELTYFGSDMGDVDRQVEYHRNHDKFVSEYHDELMSRYVDRWDYDNYCAYVECLMYLKYGEGYEDGYPKPDMYEEGSSDFVNEPAIRDWFMENIPYMSEEEYKYAQYGIAYEDIEQYKGIFESSTVE